MGERFARGVTDALGTALPVDAGDLRVARSWLPLDLDPMPRRGARGASSTRPSATRESADIVAIGDRLVLARRIERASRRADRHDPPRPGTSHRRPARRGLPRARAAVRAASPFADTLVAAYNDNTLQYIPTEAAFPDGAYEVDGGWRYIRPGEGERMADEAVRLLETAARVAPGRLGPRARLRNLAADRALLVRSKRSPRKRRLSRHSPALTVALRPR